MLTATRTDDVRTRPTVASVLSVLYGAGCYLAFVVVFVYGVAFTADVVVPRTVDHGGPETGTALAVTIDVALLMLFAIQHSVMARPAFKRRWTTVVPRHIERSTYVLAATAALALVFWQWRPIPVVVWDVPAPAARLLLWTLFAAGWVWVLAMSFAIDHVDLFGLRQVARYLRGLAEPAPSFRVPLPYRVIRQPMMLGFFPAFLATPAMTAGHLLFAALGTTYLLVGVAVTPRLIPRLPRGRR
jgi:protein-S-isoprenylcysteine O-methyltransferase Ste14